MKILYLDFLCPKGHINLDINQINILSSIGDVIVVSKKGRYRELPFNVKNIENENIEIKKGKIKNRLSSLKIMLISAFESRKIEYDYILVSSYETIMFCLGRQFFKKNDKIILIHHFNTDELSNKTKAWFFKKYMNKVIHIVFSDFIKDYLIHKFDIDDNRIFVIPHHMNEIKDAGTLEKEFGCVGLSSSNDEEIIAEIVQNEKRKEVFKKNKFKLVLKSKNFKFDNGFLKVVNGFLEKNIFDYYINNAQSIYMPFPSTYKYRMSGTLIDALSNNKVVYGSNIPMMQYYSNKYPKICKIVNSSDDFIESMLKNIHRKHNNYEEYEKFKRDHSKGAIEEAFKKMFKSI